MAKKQEWKEYEFKKAGFVSNITKPTAKVTKSGINFYRIDFPGGQPVKVLQNGSSLALVADEDSPKKLKANKSGSRVSLGSKKMVQDLGLPIGSDLPGRKAEMNGKDAWVFDLK